MEDTTVFSRTILRADHVIHAGFKKRICRLRAAARPASRTCHNLLETSSSPLTYKKKKQAKKRLFGSDILLGESKASAVRRRRGASVNRPLAAAISNRSGAVSLSLSLLDPQTTGKTNRRCCFRRIVARVTDTPLALLSPSRASHTTTVLYHR